MSHVAAAQRGCICLEMDRREVVAVAMLISLAVALTIIAALGCEGVRSPAGAFGQMGEQLGVSGAAMLFTIAAATYLGLYLCWRGSRVKKAEVDPLLRQLREQASQLYPLVWRNKVYLQIRRMMHSVPNYHAAELRCRDAHDRTFSHTFFPYRDENNLEDELQQFARGSPAGSLLSCEIALRSRNDRDLIAQRFTMRRG